jgi:hypothetical protein
MSVKFDGGYYRASTPSGAGDFEIRGWVRIDGYSTNDQGFVALGLASEQFIGCETADTGAGNFDAWCYGGGVGDAVAILTGSDTDWVFVCLQKAASSSEWTVKFLREGESSITTVGTIDSGTEPTTMDTTHVGNNPFGSPQNSTQCSFGIYAGLHTDSELVAIANDLDYSGGSSEDTFLRMTAASGGSTNSGTGGSFSTSGTPTNGSDEPTVGGGGLESPVGRSDETDTAFALAELKLRATGLSTEADSSLGLTRVKVRAAGLCTSPNTSLGLARLKVRAVGLCTSSNTSFALAKRKTKTTGLNTSSNTSLALTRRKLRAAGLGTSANASLALAELKVRVAGRSDEADTSIPLTQGQSLPVGRSDETDSAFGLGKLKLRAFGLCIQTNTSLALAKRKTKAAGRSDSTNVALTLSRAKLRATGLASQSNTAFSLSKRKFLIVSLSESFNEAFSLLDGTLPVGRSNELNSAFALVCLKSRIAGICLETSAAFALGKRKLQGIGLSEEFDIGLAPGFIDFETHTEVEQLNSAAAIVRVLDRAERTGSSSSMFPSVQTEASALARLPLTSSSVGSVARSSSTARKL